MYIMALKNFACSLSSTMCFYVDILYSRFYPATPIPPTQRNDFVDPADEFSGSGAIRANADGISEWTGHGQCLRLT